MAPHDLLRVFETLPGHVAVLRAAPGFPVVAMSRSLQAMSSDPDNVVGRPLFELFPESEQSRGSIEALQASFERVVRSRAPEQHEQRFDIADRASGRFEERYWLVVNTPVLDDDGAVEYILHQSEDAATGRRHGSMAILDAMTEGVFTLDRQWRFSYVNPEAHRILRAEPGSLVGAVIWERFPGSRNSAFSEHYRRTMHERVATTFTGFYPGLEGWYEVTVYPAPEGISVYFRDVTARVLAEQDRERLAAESEHQRRVYETALDNTPDFVYVFGTDHRAIYANQALLRVWGVDDVRGRTWLDLGYEQWHADLHDRELAEVIATRAPIRGEIRSPAPTAGASTTTSSRRCSMRRARWWRLPAPPATSPNARRPSRSSTSMRSASPRPTAPRTTSWPRCRTSCATRWRRCATGWKSCARAPSRAASRHASIR